MISLTAAPKTTLQQQSNRGNPYYRTHNRNTSLRRIHLQKDLQLNLQSVLQQNSSESDDENSTKQQPLASPFHERSEQFPPQPAFLGGGLARHLSPPIGSPRINDYFRTSSGRYNNNVTDVTAAKLRKLISQDAK